MAYGGPFFMANEALLRAEFEEFLRFAVNNRRIEQFFIPTPYIDSAVEQHQENKDELKESTDKKNMNDKVTNIPVIQDNISESSVPDQLSKRAKRRNRKKKNIKSISNVYVNESQGKREEEEQIIHKLNKPVNQNIKDVKKINKEQHTVKAKKIFKKVTDAVKVIEPRTKANNNSTKISKANKKHKVDSIKSTLPSKKQNVNKLPLFVPREYCKIDTTVNSSKAMKRKGTKCIQETNNEKQECDYMKTQHNKERILEKDKQVDKTLTAPDDEYSDKEENSEWQTVINKKHRPHYLPNFSRYASSPVSSNDEKLWQSESCFDDFSFFVDNDKTYGEVLSDKNKSITQSDNCLSTFGYDNRSGASYKNRNDWPVLESKSNTDYSQLLVESEEKERREKIQSFVGNKENWTNIKSKKKGKIKNAEHLTLYPLTHVQSQDSSKSALLEKKQTNQLTDLFKDGFWSLENIPKICRTDICDKSKNIFEYAHKEIELIEDNMATTYDVPGRLLNDLKCGLCSEPLSYPPITLSADNGSVCGRCPTLETVNNTQPLREESYERVAGLFNFPCRYHPQGCMEKLLMKNMVSHEQSCTFKPYFCPVLPLGNCAWQGSSTELHGHFAISHQINLLENPVFELDIVNNYKELYLVPYLGQLFLLRTEFNCTDEIFRFTLYFVGSSESAGKYEYELVFLTANEDAQYTHPKKPVDVDDNLLDRKNECNVSLGSLKEILQVPTTITCRLKINVTQEGQSKDLPSVTVVDLDQTEYDSDEYFYQEEEDEDDDEEVEQDIKKNISDDMVDKMMLDMECPVCQEVMIPPIYQCVIGHSVCDSCKPKLKECPTCRNTIANTRNFTLERLSENLRYKCKNRIDGCTYETNSSGIRQHEGECKFNPHRCPLHNILNCDWLGKSSKILSHVRTTHPDHFQDNSIFTVSYNSSCVSNESMKILKVHGEIFRIRFNYSNQMKQVSCTVQFTGPSSEASKFMYEMHVMDMNNTGLQLMSKKYCGALSDAIDDLKHSTMWHLDMVLPFASIENLLKMRCVVTKV